jgi:hypothetical protein
LTLATNFVDILSESRFTAFNDIDTMALGVI